MPIIGQCFIRFISCSKMVEFPQPQTSSCEALVGDDDDDDDVLVDETVVER